MKIMNYIAAIAALLLSGTSCQGIINEIDERTNPYKPVELSTKSAAFVEKGEDFSFAFIDHINASAKEDYIISPLSMQFLLGMLLDGARGDTAAEIAKVLGYGAGEVDAVNEYCLSMLKQLPELDKKTKLTIANAIFVDDGWPLLDSYTSMVKQYYRAEVSNLDFKDNAGSLKKINGWCNKQTNGLVPKVLDKVDPNMLAYLLNALYFKSQWKEKFQKAMTAEETFTYENGTKGKAMMMKMDKEFNYNDNDIYKIVSLPYGNGAYSMVALLPQPGHTVAEVTKALRKTDWNELRGSLVRCDVDLWLPKFETKFHIKLNDILSEMGMPLAFDSTKADFKAMSDFALCLSFVQQDAIIKVDEEGTEAAAVSIGGMMKETAVAPGEHVIFHADRPFLYLITESSTGVILFAGRYGSK
jgi:serpin B